MGHLQLPDRNRSIGLYPEKSDTWLKAVSSHLLLPAGPKLRTFSWEQGSATPAQETQYGCNFACPADQLALNMKVKDEFEKADRKRIIQRKKSPKGSTTPVCAKLKGVKNDLMRRRWRTVPGPFAPVFLCYLAALSLSGSPVAGKVCKHILDTSCEWLMTQRFSVNVRSQQEVLLLSGLTQLSWVIEWVWLCV